MEDATRTLLLTRPEAQSNAFLATCENLAKRSLPVVTAPLMEIVPAEALPDFAPFNTLVLTSQNAVTSIGRNLAGRVVKTVGQATAEAAKDFDADATSIGRDVSELLENAGKLTAPVLHCRGVHSHGEVAKALTAKGVLTEEAIVYDQKALSLTPEARSLLVGSAPVVVPVFSSRTAQLLIRYEITAPAVFVVISEAVKTALGNHFDIRVASEPTATSMAAEVIRCF